MVCRYHKIMKIFFEVCKFCEEQKSSGELQLVLFTYYDCFNLNFVDDKLPRKIANINSREICIYTYCIINQNICS